MTVKTVNYKNIFGEPKTKEVYFHLYKTEIRELNNVFEGGLIGALDKVVEDRSVEKLMDLVSYLVLQSYGERSQDGEEFMKTDEIRRRFKCSAVYDAIMTSFWENPDTIGEFLTSLIPKASQKAATAQDRVTNITDRIKTMNTNA